MDITPALLESILAGDPDELKVHLQLVERDVVVNGQRVKIHCHCLTLDGNGRVRPKRLAEFMRNAVADYAIPRSKLQEARERDDKFRSSSAVSALNQQAREVFTDLSKSGEGGEMLLFLLAERFLGMPQVLCKMDLKTDTRMHYHGADGVYASVADDGHLKLYWGESKLYKSASAAIRDCLSSLAPFLLEEEHTGAERERDLILLSDKADLNDPKLTEAFRGFFDRTSVMSNRVQYCGLALVGFDADFYPHKDASGVADMIETGARTALKDWSALIEGRISAEHLEGFEIHFFCIPFPSVEEFRAALLDALGASS